MTINFRGFSHLFKLDGTKTNDQTLNLMNFIVEIVEETDPDLMKFVLELEEVRKAAKVNDENLRGQIRNNFKQY